MPGSSTDFLDTNIVLGCTIEWDSLATAVTVYLHERGYRTDLVTSTRVFDEAESVIEKQRKRAREAAEKIFEDFDQGQYDTIDDVTNFVYREFSEEWGKVSPILSYIEHHSDAYLGITKTDSINVLRPLYDEIKEDFEAPLNGIRAMKGQEDSCIEIRHFDQIRPNYQSTYEDPYAQLEQLLQQTDRDILLDAHHFTETTATQTISFVTFDRNDIVSNSERIENCLGSVQVVDTRVYST